ncbi:glycosyltransferase family 2 protein [Polaribacter aquimarinus]|uniref:Glycosyltransferase 2-like domain-containing protein n=1 Tax=Polaribacter aquimarinus TaxID=2100726 RepID=A0A2U2J7J3_9FLAO|nr:glycosyltransferase family 2 protein [Polaribacter aquimarinus]PWG04261.1 hypothetical protein DIS07_12670 [Polaribacter aquimarinus]
MDISIVVTCYNDSEIILPLVDKLETNIPTNYKYEIILVNDFSTDNTETIIEQLCNINKRIKLISLSKNFGQQIAMSVGINNTKGEIVIIMDGDLQNPPNAIPLLIKEINKGFDLVYTVSKNRNNLKTKVSSYLFWFFVTEIFKVDIVKNQLMMKAFTKKIVNSYKEYSENSRTVAGILKNTTSNYSILKIENSKRYNGKSNYNLVKRLNLMVDLVIDLTTYPLNAMIFFGFCTFILTIFVSIYFIVNYFITSNIPVGYTSILLSILFFGGLTIFILGFIGRYLANIYIEVKSRPFYHVKRKLNF